MVVLLCDCDFMLLKILTFNIDHRHHVPNDKCYVFENYKHVFCFYYKKMLLKIVIYKICEDIKKCDVYCQVGPTFFNGPELYYYIKN